MFKRISQIARCRYEPLSFFAETEAPPGDPPAEEPIEDDGAPFINPNALTPFDRNELSRRVRAGDLQSVRFAAAIFGSPGLTRALDVSPESMLALAQSFIGAPYKIQGSGRGPHGSGMDAAVGIVRETKILSAADRTEIIAMIEVFGIDAMVAVIFGAHRFFSVEFIPDEIDMSTDIPTIRGGARAIGLAVVQDADYQPSRPLAQFQKEDPMAERVPAPNPEPAQQTEAPSEPAKNLYKEKYLALQRDRYSAALSELGEVSNMVDRVVEITAPMVAAENFDAAIDVIALLIDGAANQAEAPAQSRTPAGYSGADAGAPDPDERALALARRLGVLTSARAINEAQNIFALSPDEVRRLANGGR